MDNSFQIIDGGTQIPINIGTVTTLDPGDQATATIKLTMSGYVLDLGIPAGTSGDVMKLAEAVNVETIDPKARAYAFFTEPDSAGVMSLSMGIPQGITFTPHLSAEGVLSWENNGSKSNPQPVPIVGTPGSAGVTFIPSVTSGVLSWTNTGDLDNPAPVNITSGIKDYCMDQIMSAKW